MLPERYFAEMRKVLDKIEKTQMENLNRAADFIVESAAQGGCLHILDTGHMLMHEAVGRVGGLMMMTPVHISVEVNNPARPRKGVSKKRVFLDEIAGFPEFVLAKSEIYRGDVLIVGSVSGKNVLPVEVAIRAREQGVKVIAVTSVEYSSSLKAEHPSGKRLYEVADVVLDNGSIVGDAVVPVEGLDVKICPTSGIAAAYLIWALTAQVVEKMLARGMKPSIYMSNHLPGADAYNRQALQEYQEKGY